MSIDDGFTPHWLDEKDWLVDVVMMDEEDKAESLEYVGKLFGFSMATNTRMLALVGDPHTLTYELWFSFTDQQSKQKFLDLVREDGYANPDEEGTLKPPPSLTELPELRPLTRVFSKDDADYITAMGTVTAHALGMDTEKRN